MKILIVYQYLHGIDKPGHSLVLRFAKFLLRSGHDVRVITSGISYMDPAAGETPGDRGSAKEVEGVPVTIVRSYRELHAGYFSRLLSFLSFSTGVFKELLFAQKPDLVYASSPPLFPVFFAALACRIRKIPFAAEIRDLWPDAAIQLGIVRSKPLVAMMRWMEHVIYRSSDRIVCLTEGIRDQLQARGFGDVPMHVARCSVDTNRLHPDTARREACRLAHGWEDKRIVMYFGAHGVSNNLEVLLDAADRLRAEPGLFFVLVGDGMHKARLMSYANARGTANIAFIDAVGHEQAIDFLNAADICVATLKDIPLFYGAIPTKVIEYMACAKPVVSNLNGEAAALIELAGCGVNCPPGDVAALAAAVSALAKDDTAISRLGESGRNHVVKCFSEGENHALLLAFIRAGVSH